jgi:hypothetical protein
MDTHSTEFMKMIVSHLYTVSRLSHFKMVRKRSRKLATSCPKIRAQVSVLGASRDAGRIGPSFDEKEITQEGSE